MIAAAVPKKLAVAELSLGLEAGILSFSVKLVNSVNSGCLLLYTISKAVPRLVSVGRVRRDHLELVAGFVQHFHITLEFSKVSIQFVHASCVLAHQLSCNLDLRQSLYHLYLSGQLLRRVDDRRAITAECMRNDSVKCTGQILTLALASLILVQPSNSIIQLLEHIESCKEGLLGKLAKWHLVDVVF